MSNKLDILKYSYSTKHFNKDGVSYVSANMPFLKRKRLVECAPVMVNPYIEIPNDFKLESQLQGYCQLFLCNKLGLKRNKDFLVHENCGVYSPRDYPGYPDLLILTKGYNSKHLLIEFKSKTGIMSPKQVNMCDKLRADGNNSVYVINSFPKFLEAIGEYFLNNKNAFTDNSFITRWNFYLTNDPNYGFFRLDNERVYWVETSKTSKQYAEFREITNVKLFNPVQTSLF